MTHQNTYWALLTVVKLEVQLSVSSPTKSISINRSWGFGCVPGSSLRRSMQCLGPADCQMLCFCNTTFYILLHSNCLLIFSDGGVWWSCPRLRVVFFKTRAHVTRVSSSSWHFFSSCRHLASTEAVGVCWCCLGRGWVNKARSTDEIPQVVSRTICFFTCFHVIGGEWHGITVQFTNLDLLKMKQPVVAKLSHRPCQQFTLTSASRSASA